MNLLFLGDVVGEIGSEFVGEKLGGLKKFYNAEVVIVNGENSANGNGITPHSAKYLFSHGADIITTGNHCYRRREIYETMDREERLLRPANFPEGNPGHGVCLYDMGKCTIAVINLMGTVYMEALDNPFSTVDRLLGEIDTPNIFVDFHAEATGGKGHGCFRYSHPCPDCGRDNTFGSHGLHHRRGNVRSRAFSAGSKNRDRNRKTALSCSRKIYRIRQFSVYQRSNCGI